MLPLPEVRYELGLELKIDKERKKFVFAPKEVCILRSEKYGYHLL
jgi:hypothetical protein